MLASEVSYVFVSLQLAEYFEPCCTINATSMLVAGMAYLHGLCVVYKSYLLPQGNAGFL